MTAVRLTVTDRQAWMRIEINKQTDSFLAPLTFNIAGIFMVAKLAALHQKHLSHAHLSSRMKQQLQYINMENQSSQPPFSVIYFFFSADLHEVIHLSLWYLTFSEPIIYFQCDESLILRILAAQANFSQLKILTWNLMKLGLYLYPQQQIKNQKQYCAV